MRAVGDANSGVASGYYIWNEPLKEVTGRAGQQVTPAPPKQDDKTKAPIPAAPAAPAVGGASPAAAAKASVPEEKPPKAAN